MQQRVSKIILLFIGFCCLMPTVIAQSEPLTYGTLLTESLAPGSPRIYTFSGNANDYVSAYILGDSNIQATLALANSSGISLGFSDDDPLTISQNDARVTALLPSTDTYIMTINNVGTATGTVTIALTGQASAPDVPFTGSKAVEIVPDSPLQILTIAGSTSDQMLSVQNLDPTRGYVAQVFSQSGRLLAMLSDGVTNASVTLLPTDEQYRIVLMPTDPAIGANVQLSIGDSASQNTSQAVPQNNSNNAAPSTTVTDPNACVATSANANLRGGPGTNYSVVGALVNNSQMVITGQNTGWYYGNYNGSMAWVASSVVSLSGPCNNLAFVQAPPAPVQATAPNNAVTPTTATTQVAPTATTSQDNTNNPTQAPPTATATATATTQQVAFTVVSMDCRYVFNDGAYVNHRVEGPPNGQYRIEVRQGSTVYSGDYTMNDQGFRTQNQRFRVGNSNYTAYIMYNGVDVRSAPCD